MPAPPHHHRANFNPPAPCGAGPHGHCRPGGTAPISIHPPRAGRDVSEILQELDEVISIHPPRAERDSSQLVSTQTSIISIHPPRAGRDMLLASTDSCTSISIHPPRAGRDSVSALRALHWSNFNPPAPCGAGRNWNDCRPHQTYFNPPAPCGAGLQVIMTGAILGYFNPPAPCGAGPSSPPPFLDPLPISIHPPRAGRDPCAYRIREYSRKFQSTRPVRGGTARELAET